MASAEELLEAISGSLCEEALNLIAEGFGAGADPYGDPWDAPNNLQITGRLRAYTKQRVDAGGFMIGSTDQKALWHHDPQPRESWGDKSLPVRRQVPDARGLPDDWEQRLDEAAKDAAESLGIGLDEFEFEVTL